MTYLKLPSGYLRIADSAIIPEQAPGNRDWEAVQAWLAQGNVPQSSNHSIAEVIALKSQENADEATRRLDVYVAGKSAAEMSSWTSKAEDSRRFLASQNIDEAEALAVEAAQTVGTSDPTEIAAATQALAELILTKEAQLKLAAALIIGTRSRIDQELNSLSTWKAVRDYQVLTRWEQLIH